MKIELEESPCRSAELDERGHRSYRRTFCTRGPLGLTQEDHEAAPGLPKKGETYRGQDGALDVHAVCLGHEQPVDASTCKETGWTFTFVYSTDPDKEV